MKQSKSYKIAVVGVMAALASVIYYFIPEIPILPLAPHIKVGFSDIPVLIAGLTVGPLGGVLVAFVKCLFHLFQTTTFGIGELIKFIINTGLVLSMFYSYRFCLRAYKKQKNSLPAYATAAAIAMIVSVVVAWLANMTLAPVLLDMFGTPMAFDQILTVYVFGSTLTNVVNAVLNMLPVYPIHLALRQANRK